MKFTHTELKRTCAARGENPRPRAVLDKCAQHSGSGRGLRVSTGWQALPMPSPTGSPCSSNAATANTWKAMEDIDGIVVFAIVVVAADGVDAVFTRCSGA